jgi:hypothetical protein
VISPAVDGLIELTQTVAAVFEACGVTYYASHPLTNLLMGQSNATGNLVIVAVLKPSQSEVLIQELTAEFRTDPTEIHQTASGERSGFGLTHLQSWQLVEVWQSRADAFSKAKMARRLQYSLPSPMPHTQTTCRASIWLGSVEDTILEELLTQGGRSGQRWQNLLELLKFQAAYLDYAYLGEWANWLGVSQILSWALLEAEI